MRVSEGKWDSGCVCDPSVIRGEFAYKEETYTWLMAYLGCTTTDNTSNAYGYAVSHSPEGPWVKIPDPMWDFYEAFPGYIYTGSNEFIWGIGQPSIVSADKKSKVLVFYSGNASTGQRIELWDFSDMANPICYWSEEVNNEGIVDLYGEKDTICNADFVYDGYRNNFYLLCDVHPFDDYQWPTNLPLATNMYAMPTLSNRVFTDEFGMDLITGKWTKIFALDELSTGFPRNSNTGFFRDPYGWLPQEKGLEVAYMTCSLGDDWKVLYYYRIYRKSFLINF